MEKVDITPAAATLRTDSLYFNRKFDKITYILSEFIDNALQSVLLEYFDRIKHAKDCSVAQVKARQPWIRLTIIVDKSGQIAFCVEDNGSGIRHERLASALTQKVRIARSLVAGACMPVSLPIMCLSAPSSPSLWLLLDVTQQKPDMVLKASKLKYENERRGFLNALLSEYGVGLKQVSRCIAATASA